MPRQLRDLCDFDVLDELLIADGALKPDKYKILIAFQSDFIDQPILDKINDYVVHGGTILFAGSDPPCNLDGTQWKPIFTRSAGKLIYAGGKLTDQLKKLAATIKPLGWDGAADGVWTTRRGLQVFRYNNTDKAVKVDGVDVPAHEIWSND